MRHKLFRLRKNAVQLILCRFLITYYACILYLVSNRSPRGQSTLFSSEDLSIEHESRKKRAKSYFDSFYSCNLRLVLVKPWLCYTERALLLVRFSPLPSCLSETESGHEKIDIRKSGEIKKFFYFIFYFLSLALSVKFPKWKSRRRRLTPRDRVNNGLVMLSGTSWFDPPVWSFGLRQIATVSSSCCSLHSSSSKLTIRGKEWNEANGYCKQSRKECKLYSIRKHQPTHACMHTYSLLNIQYLPNYLSHTYNTVCTNVATTTCCSYEQHITPYMQQEKKPN